MLTVYSDNKVHDFLSKMIEFFIFTRQRIIQKREAVIALMKAMRRAVHMCDDLVTSIEMIQSFFLLLEGYVAVANLHL